MTTLSERPRGEAILAAIDALPAGTWRRCGGCRAVLSHDRLAARRGVCPECGWYFRLTATERIDALTDAGSFVEHDTGVASQDVLGFTDTMPYTRRLDRAAEATGLSEGMVVGRARIAGHPAVLAVMDFHFLGGSMGSALGERFARAADLAIESGLPLVAVSASGGARMQEGTLSLLQMAATSAAVERLNARGLPYVSVLTDPVYGGVAASFAALGDVVIAESGARAGFAGPQVIEQTIRQELPAGFQTAAFLLEHGHIDMVLARHEIAGVLGTLLGLLTDRPGAEPPPPATAPVATVPVATVATGPGRDEPDDAYAAVRRARTPGRPTVRDYLAGMADDFVELRGDRSHTDDPAIVGGVARVAGRPVMVIGHAKGRDTAENVHTNFGMPHPSGYRKALRLMELAERLDLPLVTLIDTPGAYPGLDAEAENQSGAIAACLRRAATLRVPVVAVVTGEGGSGGALALAVGDRLLMLEHSVLSVISPEGCATILYGDASRAPEAARELRLRASELLEMGVADALVAEPDGGAHTDHAGITATLRARLDQELDALRAVGTEELTARRHERLRRFGTAAARRSEAVRDESRAPEPADTREETSVDAAHQVDKEDLRRTVAEIVEVPADELTDQTRFIDELGVDSLIALEVVICVERKYGVKLDESNLAALTCLDAVHRTVVDSMSAA